jgi:hypothetical protein
MKVITTLILTILSLATSAQDNFGKYFTGKALRFDFMFAGNNNSIKVYPVGMKEELYWPGSVNNLKDPFNYGNFKYEVFSVADNHLLYSRGFCTLFQEWQTTDEAKTTERCFYEVPVMPFPKDRIRFVLSRRVQNGNFSEIYKTEIDPTDYYIKKEIPINVTFTRIYGNGNSENSVDLAFIAEGYTTNEMGKFREDVRRMADVLFSETPFSDYRDKFNIWAVEAVSSESGTDLPGERIYLNTALNSSFYTFGTDRYLTTQDIKTINDYAASVPHDNIIVLINSNKYGGGGVYNYYSGTTTGHLLSPKVFIHEFGHGFAGLADEYYSSSVAYNDFYPLDTEPWEPNITTRVDFDLKWKKMIKEGTPLPTPDEEKYRNRIGLFEGGGYSARGIFRPESDCRMKSNGEKGYCSVCREAIKKMIEFYTK